MDPLTHMASGLVVANLIRRDHHSKWAIPFCMAMAALPDIDIVFAASSEMMLLYRRAITHSVLTIPILALLTFWISKRIFPDFRPWKLYLLNLGLLALHIAFDIINSYGTQIFWPLSTHRHQWHLVYIIDPLFTAGIVTLGLLGVFKRKMQKQFAIAGLAFCIGYPGICFGIREIVRRDVQVEGASTEILPDAFSPFYWKILDSTQPDLSTIYTLRSWSFIDGVTPLPSSLKWEKTIWAYDLKEDPKIPSFIKTYAWFASHCAIPITSSPLQGTLMEDLRFVSIHDWLRNSRMLSGSKTPSPFSMFSEYGVTRNNEVEVTRITFNNKVVFERAPEKAK